MSHRPATLAAFVFAAALVTRPVPGLAQSQSDECSAPPAAMELGAPLNHTGERLREGLPVKIVAIGSSSTAGAGASDAAHSYPSQLAAALERRFPRAAVTVLNKGVNGEETPNMLARFQRDVFDEHPDLVIWQTGSNEILRHGSPEYFAEEVREGLRRLRGAGIETILMDAQFAPRILDNPDYATFNATLRRLAESAKMAFLDRFEAMRHWFDRRQNGAPAMVGKDQVHMSDAGYHCVARLLATLIVADLPRMAAR